MSTEVGDVGEVETEAAARAPVEPLRLLAEDADDLHIISAALQDAILRPVDIVWEPSGRRVTLKLSRFCWECGGTRVMAAMQCGPRARWSCWRWISSRERRRAGG